MKPSFVLLLAIASTVALFPAIAQRADGEIPIETVPNLPNGPYSLAFSSDGMRAASGGGDGTVHLWDVASGRLLRVLPGHADNVLAVRFSSDGTRVVGKQGQDRKAMGHHYWPAAAHDRTATAFRKDRIHR